MAAMAPAGFAGDGGDPRRPSAGGGYGGDGQGRQASVAVATGHKMFDPNVSFEEYLFYAKISRADQRYEDPDHSYRIFGKTVKKGRYVGDSAYGAGDGELNDVTRFGKDEYGSKDHSPPAPFVISDAEYVTASRATRTATWGAVFYLITTDILGPYSTAWAFAAMGYAPGVVLYTIFGILAGYGGFLLWKMFLGLDSDRYPLKTYGDVAYRVYGTTTRHAVNLLQSVQLLFNVGIIIVVNGLSLVQVITGANANAYSCFIIMCFVWAIGGMLFGQIRTLARLGWLANAAIWMNVFVIISSMVVVARTGINDESGVNNGLNPSTDATIPVLTTVGPAPGVGFQTQVVGLMQAVYSYGGAMLFVEFMAEMRRPFDFWKGMMLAQTFIYVMYMMYGLFIYSYQGQYSVNPSYQGISNDAYAWQTVANSLGLVTGLIAALLYGNIGIKVIYNNILMDLLRFPSLTSRAGKLAWVVTVPIYWAVAFIIAAAIPQVSNLQGLIGAFCILQFSYTFPPFLMIGYLIKRDAMVPGDGFDPVTGTVRRMDSGVRRWVRGYMKRPIFNTWNLIFCLGSLTTAILGVYSAIVGIIATYGAHPGTSFTCNNPYAPPSS